MLKLFDYKTCEQAFLTTGISGLLIGAWVFLGMYLFPGFAPTPAEYIGTWLTLACVWLTGRQNMWCWPIGIVSVLFFAYAFYQFGLYASAFLNAGYYFLVQFWGWYQWEKGRTVMWTQSWPERLAILVGIITFTALWGYFTSYTDAQYILVDCLIMGISIIAQWLLNYKRPEAWLLFITVNVLSTWLYLTSGLYMIGALYFGFIFIASYGIYQWIRDHNNHMIEKSDEEPILLETEEFFSHETRIPTKESTYV